MAVVKEITGKLLSAVYSTNASSIREICFLNKNNTVLIENESQQTLYLNNEAHDSITLTPYFDKNAIALNKNAKNIFNNFSSNMLLTSKPQCKTNFNDDILVNSPNMSGYYKVLDYIKYSNETFHKNLTSEAYNFSSNFYKFTANNQEYTLFLTYSFEGATYYEQTTHFILVKGNDYSNPIATLELDYDTSFLSVQNVAQTVEIYFEILTVDTTDLSNCFAILSFNVNGAGSTANRRDKSQGLASLNFDLSTFAWKASQITSIYPNSTFSGNQNELLKDTDVETSDYNHNKLSHNLFYCGKDTSSNHVFMDLNLDVDYASDGGTTADGEVSFTLYELDEINMRLDATTRFVASNNNISNVKAITNNFTAGDLVNIYCSKFQALDSNNSNAMYSYVAAFDDSGNFKPIRIKWNKDVVISSYANTDPVAPLYVDECTVTFPNSNPSTNYIENWAVDYSGVQLSLDQGISSSIPLLTKSLSILDSTNNVINFCYLTKKSELTNALHAQNPLHSDLTSFSIDVSNFGNNSDLNLTYQSAYTLKAIDLIYNSDVNKIKAIVPTGIKMLSYSGNAWVLSSEHDGIYNVLAEDSYERNWALNMPTADLSSLNNVAYHGTLNIKDVNMKVELLSDTLPYVTSLTLETPNQTYAGSDLLNKLIVNAYDETNTRVTKDVRLTIEGNNCTFNADTTQGITAGATTAVVTTSTSADTEVDITITNSGLINISASFDL